MAHSARRPRAGRKAKWLLGSVLVIALLCVLFQWDWLRPPLERYLLHKSGREVRAGHMEVSGLFTLQPTVTFQRAFIQNAPWADAKQPMATAGEASFTFPLRGLFDEHTIISKIVLKDADVDMEKQADGLRNWRLRNPDDRGPPKISVLRLEAYRSQLRFVDRNPERAYDIRFVARDVGAEKVTTHGGRALVNRIEAQGVYRGGAFTAEALTGPVLTFRETSELFAVRGHAASGKTRIELDGEAGDMFARPLLDATVSLSGATLSQLHPFILVQPANSRAYRFEGDVRRTGTEYRVTKLRGKIGETDLAGDASHDLRDGRHLWRANLHSASADLHDLGTLAGIPYPTKAPNPDRLFPQQPMKTDRLRAQDVHVRLDAKRMATPGMPALEGLRFEADLENGILQAKGLDIAIAGGHASGQATLDARNDVPHGRANLKLAGLRLERLFTKLPPDAHKAGPLRGMVNLEGSGASIAAMLGASSGKVDLAMDGGSISNRLDAELSLNLGKLAGLVFKGDHDIPIRCAVAGFDVSGGKGKVRALLIETEQTRIDGAGGIDLRAERTDLVLVPHPKKPGLLTLGASINVNGSFRHPGFQFHKGGAGAPQIASNAQCPGKPAAVTAQAASTR
jgi:uncharacterized protein involved in outer membrane biogenesis